MKHVITCIAVTLNLAGAVHTLEYPHTTAEPQKTGWPLTAEERAYVVEKPEHDRRPGRELNKHLPQLWPQVPSAGFFGGDSWLKLHEAHVKTVQANQGPCDALLVGDSITIQWGDSWKKHFPDLKAVNIGIGGDKTQNVLWRLDHGGVEGLQPKAIVLMIGNNNMFFTPETGIEAAALGIQMCVKNLREKFPAAAIIVAKILPAHSPGNRFYEDIKETNAALDPLKLDSDAKVRVLDLWSDFVNADGTQKKDLFTPDNIHLSPAGYAVYAERLKPLLDAFFSGKPMPAAPAMPPKASTAPAPEKPADSKPAAAAPKAASGIVLPSKPVLTYAYTPYNEGKLDPQIAGWPLTADELAWVTKGEYTRKPGHDAQKHLPEMWPITPTAPRWGEGETNPWIEHHAQCIEKVQAMKDGIDIMLIGDSITQGWGGGWDGAPFNAAWQKHFGDKKTVNLGIGGDRTEGVLWRLDHGAVHGASPKTIVLMIGVNNSNGVQANGVPVSAAVEGIRLCVANLRQRCPESQIVLVKILPAFDPAKEVGAKVREMNAALDALKLESDPKVRVLVLWADFTNADGTLKTELYSDKHLHLGPAGYEVFASKLKPLLEILTAAADIQAREQYLLLNYSTSLTALQQARDMMGYVRGTFGEANRRSRLKVGLAIIYTPKEQVTETAARLRADLALAEQMDVPVLIQVDTENWLPESLLNWHDPKKPGYDPSKVNDVEWTGWTPDTAVKLCWRNWGTMVRVGPHPNLLSPRFQAWEQSIYTALAPVVVEWLKKLPEEKRSLFVGWKCGWETTPNSQYAYFKDGNSYLTRTDNPKWIEADKQLIGYNAARTGGFQTSGVLDYQHSYDVFMKIIGAHLSFLAKTARSLGLPREKLFVHTIAQGVDRFNMDSQFNAESNPSPSFYGKPTTSLRDNPSFMRCLAKGRAELGTTGYGIGEFVFGAKDYDTWHHWFTDKLAADPDLIFAALYNYDRMKGQPEIERAMLDAMKKTRN